VGLALGDEFVKMTKGKWVGLQAVSDRRGVIAAVAIDQRNALRELLAKAQGVKTEAIPGEMLVQFKEAVSRALTPHASAILLDPEYGLAAARLRAKSAGLLLAYEQTGYDKAIAGRLPHLLPGYSVRRLIAAGADCIKVLLYYSPLSTPEINDQKHAWVERVGAECVAADVPFFLELVCYHDQMKSSGIEFARTKPEIIARSLEEFSRPQYAVDVFKVGVPINVAFVQGLAAPGAPTAYTREEALAHFRSADAAVSRPFIYLSEGISTEMFREALQLGAESGARFSGVLCGRATWGDGVGIYVKSGRSALEEWLNSHAVKNIQQMNELLLRATPWFAFYGATSAAELSG
jgi:tagatose 1,6-diphosphate aldolase